MIELLMAEPAFCVPAETRDPVAVVDEFLAAYNAHDLGRLRQVVAADATFGSPDNRVAGQQVLTNYETVVFVRYPKVRLVLEERLAADDVVAQMESTEGLWEPDRGLTVYRVKGGCIIEMSISR